MSNRKSDDDQVQKILWEAEDGLSVPRDDARAAAASARARRESSASDRIRQALRMDSDAAARWFLPAAAVIAILLVLSLAMVASQASRVDALEKELASLRSAADTSGIDPLRTQVDRLLSRVEGLETRLGAVDPAGEEIQALRSAVAEQKAAVAAMSERLDALATAGADAAKPAAGDSGSTESDATAAAPTGGDWVVNLITVTDLTEAERMQTRLKELGVESSFEEVQRDGRTLHRLVVAGFGSNEEARTFGARIQKQLGLPDEPWVTKQ